MEKQYIALVDLNCPYYYTVHEDPEIALKKFLDEGYFNRYCKDEELPVDEDVTIFVCELEVGCEVGEVKLEHIERVTL